jgi:hypothetical protein
MRGSANCVACHIQQFSKDSFFPPQLRMLEHEPTGRLNCVDSLPFGLSSRCSRKRCSEDHDVGLVGS